MAALSSFGNSIKSIQRGTITIAHPATSNTATVTAVDTAKSLLRLLGALSNVDDVRALAHIALTNSTTITATRSTSSSGWSTVVSYELVEYN